MPLLLVVVRRIEFNRPEQLDELGLFAALNEFAQCFVDCVLLGPVPTHHLGLLQQFIVEGQIRWHV